MANRLKYLDNKDNEILYHLDVDARSTISAIAKKVRMSKQSVKYRIDKLIEKKVIEKFLLFVNGTKIGYSAYKFYFQMQNIVEDKLNEIVKELTDHPLIIWVSTCDGKFDLAIAPCARNNVHAYVLLNQIYQRYASYIKDITTLNYIDVSHLKKVHLIGEKRNRIDVPFWGDEPDNYELDPYEVGILTILCENARVPTNHIARQLGCSVDIIHSRMKKLLKDGIIQGSTIILNKSSTGFEYHKILLKIIFSSDKQELSFLEFVKSKDNIVDVIRVMGEWNYELDMEVKNIYELHDLIMSIRNTFPKNIINYDSLMILNEHKLHFFPMGKRYTELIKKG